MTTICEHEWTYDPPDWDVGIQGGWYCPLCEALDEDRPPPNYFDPDDDIPF